MSTASRSAVGPPASAAAPVPAGSPATPVLSAPLPPAPRRSAENAPVDAGRWPDVARVPRASAVRTAIARLMVRRALAALPLRVSWAGGAPCGEAGPLLRVHRPDAFLRRLGADGLIGFGESYLAGEWDAEDLPGVLTVLASDVAGLIPAPLQRLRRAWAHRKPAAQRNTPDHARDNIRAHYDLSNELFALFLDETMTYSSAVFAAFPARWEALADAQRRKVDRLLDLARVTEGTRLLEIGTGWGELALRAARRGARVTTVTLSREQRDLAVRRIAAAGLADRVRVELCDYREVRGRYDAVVSVEMIEAVGPEYWPVYFARLDELTAPGGRVALQAITMPHERMLATRETYTWIHKYIFPGGVIPSMDAIVRAAEPTGLRVAACERYGAHYAQTLRLWRERFTRRAEEVAGLGFDGTFRRMWEFYLGYSEAGFASGYLDVRQLLLTRADDLAGGSR